MGKKESDLLARKKIYEFHILIILMYACTDANMLQQDSWLVYGTKQIPQVFAALENNAFCVDRCDFFTVDQNNYM